MANLSTDLLRHPFPIQFPISVDVEDQRFVDDEIMRIYFYFFRTRTDGHFWNWNLFQLDTLFNLLHVNDCFVPSFQILANGTVSYNFFDRDLINISVAPVIDHDGTPIPNWR